MKCTRRWFHRISPVLFSVLAMVSLLSATELPYSKLMDLTREELVEKKFRFDTKRNWYQLSKSNGLNNASAILGALGGKPVVYTPTEEDYAITLQYGSGDSLSSLTAVFYSDDTYNNIQLWLAENNIEPTQLGSGNTSIIKFKYDTLDVELRSQGVKQSSATTTASTYQANTAIYDKSYVTYTFIINTGIEPQSAWLDKQKSKKDAKQARGAKADLDDMF